MTAEESHNEHASRFQVVAAAENFKVHNGYILPIQELGIMGKSVRHDVIKKRVSIITFRCCRGDVALKYARQ